VSLPIIDRSKFAYRISSRAMRRVLFIEVGAWACSCGVGIICAHVTSVRDGVARVRCPHCERRHLIPVCRGQRHRTAFGGEWLMTYAPRDGSEDYGGCQIALPGFER
jgi:hypothetical protein